MATNAWLIPLTTDADIGVTEIEFKVAPVTVRVAEPFLLFSDALIVDEPANFPVAKPFESIDETVVLLEDQITELVITLLVPSE